MNMHELFTATYQQQHYEHSSWICMNYLPQPINNNIMNILY